jgi:hypothetical protein
MCPTARPARTHTMFPGRSRYPARRMGGPVRRESVDRMDAYWDAE